MCLCMTACCSPRLLLPTLEACLSAALPLIDGTQAHAQGLIISYFLISWQAQSLIISWWSHCPLVSLTPPPHPTTTIITLPTPRTVHKKKTLSGCSWVRWNPGGEEKGSGSCPSEKMKKHKITFFNVGVNTGYSNNSELGSYRGQIFLYIFSN